MILWWTTVQNYQKPPTVNTVKICLTAWQIQTGNGWKQYLVCRPDKWWKGDIVFAQKILGQQPNRPFLLLGGISQRVIVTETIGCIMKPINYEKEDPCSHADEPHHQFWNTKQWTTIKPVVLCHLVDNMARRGDKTEWWGWSFLKCVLD